MHAGCVRARSSRGLSTRWLHAAQLAVESTAMQPAVPELAVPQPAVQLAVLQPRGTSRLKSPTAMRSTRTFFFFVFFHIFPSFNLCFKFLSFRRFVPAPSLFGAFFTVRYSALVFSDYAARARSASTVSSRLSLPPNRFSDAISARNYDRIPCEEGTRAACLEIWTRHEILEWNCF